MTGVHKVLCFSKKRRVKFLRDYMEWIINRDSNWDHNVAGSAVEGPVDCVGRDEVVQALNEMNAGKGLDVQMYHWSELLPLLK